MIGNDSSMYTNGQPRSVVSSSSHLKSTDDVAPNYKIGEAHQGDYDEESTSSEDKKPAAQPRRTRARNGITKPRFEVNFNRIVQR